MAALAQNAQGSLALEKQFYFFQFGLTRQKSQGLSREGINQHQVMTRPCFFRVNACQSEELFDQMGGPFYPLLHLMQGMVAVFLHDGTQGDLSLGTQSRQRGA
jgi:hypothetical protein